MNTLREVKPLSDNPEFVAAFAKVVADARGKVCRVCGLERMGHAPESKWLGFEPHPWDGVPGDVDHANALSSRAYALHNARTFAKPCGHSFAGPHCVTQCSHVKKHCAQCAYVPNHATRENVA